MTRPCATEPAGAPLPDRSVVPPVWGRITNLVVDHGEGSWLVTTDGERYLDYTSGIGVTNTGHAHPRVVAAVQAQAAKLLHGQQNIVYHEAGLRLYDRLAHLLPGGPWSAFLSNSGAEAVEAAVKLARVATGRPVIIGLPLRLPRAHGNAMALTAAKDVYRGAFEPLPGSDLPHRLPVLLPRAGRRPRPGRLHLRLGGAAGPAVPPDGVPRQGGGDHRGAGHRGGRLHRPAAGLPAAPARDHAPARHPAHRGRGPDRLRAHRRDLRGPPLGRGAGHPGHGQGHRVGAAAVGDHRPQGGHGPVPARLPRRHLRRQRGVLRGGAMRRSTSSRTRGSAANARERGAQFLAGLRALAGDAAGHGRRPGPRADGGGRVRQARRGRRPRPEHRAHQARPAGVLRPQAPAPDRRHVRSTWCGSSRRW